jgi:hypothetical protein
LFEEAILKRVNLFFIKPQFYSKSFSSLVISLSDFLLLFLTASSKKNHIPQLVKKTLPKKCTTFMRIDKTRKVTVPTSENEELNKDESAHPKGVTSANHPIKSTKDK